MSSSLLRSAAAFAGCLALASTAQAQGADSTNLRLTGARSQGGMLLPGAQVLDASSWDLSLSWSHEEGVLGSEVSTGAIRGGERFESADWIERRDTLYLQFAIAPVERLELSGGVPMLLAQSGRQVGDLAAPRADGGAIGDPRLGVRYAFLGDAASTWVGAVQGGLLVPAGGDEYGIGAEQARTDLALTAGYRQGAWSTLLHVGHRMGERFTVGDQVLGDSLYAGAGVLLQDEVAGNRMQWSLEAVLQSVVAPAEAQDDLQRTGLEVLGGARYFLPWFYADLGAGVGALTAGSTPEWRMVASIGTTGSWASSRPAPATAAGPVIIQQVVPAGSNPEPQQPTVDPETIERVVRTAELESQAIFFHTGSAELDGEAQAVVRGVAMILHRRDGRVRINGYADDRGTPERNVELSAERAEAVRQALLDAGIGQERIEIEGLGADAPIGPATEMGRSINRRVSLSWID